MAKEPIIKKITNERIADAQKCLAEALRLKTDKERLAAAQSAYLCFGLRLKRKSPRSNHYTVYPDGHEEVRLMSVKPFSYATDPKSIGEIVMTFRLAYKDYYRGNEAMMSLIEI